ncbi:methyltransferase domain-containing protein [Clostridium sp. AWRP]|uniref:methyltransferase domain-containing protein n=1 Tax=Clostridium sp. AWRP TaxID=2212991 RepID=UPI000FD8283A|nr:methyltransferase domain-containing protein [Clostridium sp. AWRP]AZV56849.1 methyltransferase domain-containing protein [Clostridium sp. AWRP]
MDSKDNLVKDQLKDDEQINSAANKIDGEHTQPISSPKLKLVFFVKQGMDSFLDDIINGLSNEYINRKIVVSDFKQIDEGMQWADICWFEWCDELIGYGSKLAIAREKKVICRLHRYEVFTNYPKQVNWDNVDKLIIVTKHLKIFLKAQIPDINSKVDIVIVNNGVNLSKYKFKERKKGFNIAYIGYIHSRKNPVLVLQIMKALTQKDKRYKLYVAGQFQDGLIKLYWFDQIKKMKLEESVIFQGWQNNVESWLEDKNYVLSTSIHESFGYGIAEAMASGIKPIIHNFVFADEIWDKKFLFCSIDEAIKMITEEKYDSREYRNFIQDNYRNELQIDKIKQIIKNIEISSKIGQQKFDYKQYWNDRLDNKFDIEGVGYIGLGREYNEYLYKARLYTLDKIIKKLFKKSKLTTVFEIGPGIGVFTNYFKQNGISNYYAIDISKKSVEVLSSKYNNFNFIQGDISEGKNYPKNSKYDLVFSADVLLHLTDENKFKLALKNMKNVLNDNGYMIIYDAISKNEVKSTSPHVRIRSVEYIRKVLSENGMEIETCIPMYFFASSPFDINRSQTESLEAINIFNLIQVFLNQNYCNIKGENKKIVLEYLYYVDKLCLSNYKYGLSEKLLIIKKKQNRINVNIDIDDIWEKSNISDNIKSALQNIENNKELYNNNELIRIQQNVNNLILSKYTIKEVYEKINLFSGYDTDFVDKYDFDNSKAIIGKKEKINSRYALIEFILANNEAQLIVTGVIYDNEGKEIILPNYLNFSSNRNKLIEIINRVINSDMEYNNRGIAGFINDKKIVDDIKENQLAYNWERGIPATQFMPLVGYINVIERYKLAFNFIKKSYIVLEAASGFGYGAAYISKECKQVEALDLAKENILFGKKMYSFENINWVVGDVTKLPYANNYFDVYISFETLEHLPLNLVERYFSEAVRVLKNKGKMIISTPNKAVRENVRNPFHVKEYNFLEFDELLYKYFSNVQYYSIVNNRLTKGMNLSAYNMMAVCEK